MSNKFCKYLSNQARIEYGKLRPCCWFTNTINITNKDSATIYQQFLYSITDFESAKGNCRECEQREVKGLYSPRLESFERRMFNDTDKDGEIKNLEIQIDRDCNGACLICGPWNSTTWEKYEHKIKNIPIKNVPDSTPITNGYIQQITDAINFDRVENILMLGGEPLRTDSHLLLLKKIKNPELTTVQYTTNGSYRPTKEMIEVWSKFKEIYLTVSIDGIGEQFNYLRWPLQWNQVEDNIRSVLDLKGTNIVISQFSYTTTPLSLYYHNTYVDWAQEFFKDTHVTADRMFAKPWQPRGQTEMALSAIPPELADVIQSKYGPDHSVTKLLETYNPAKNIEFKNYINYHDEHRGTDWRTVFPEMVKYFS
jgi:hypothetical protein